MTSADRIKLAHRFLTTCLMFLAGFAFVQMLGHSPAIMQEEAATAIRLLPFGFIAAFIFTILEIRREIRKGKSTQPVQATKMALLVLLPALLGWSAAIWTLRHP